MTARGCRLLGCSTCGRARRARQTFGAGAPRLTRVTLGHSVPQERRAALRDYFDCALESDAACDSLEWTRELTDATPRFANAAMHAHFVAVAAPLVSAVAAPLSTADAVRMQLRRRLPRGESAMPEVARSLGVSTRTLRRRLAHERVAYHALVDEMRRELASDLLAVPDASITNVALDLGFSDGTAFARAYRRWYGKSPKSARVAPPGVSD